MADTINGNLKKLRKMFPDLPEDLLRDAYRSAEGNLEHCIEFLATANATATAALSPNATAPSGIIKQGNLIKRGEWRLAGWKERFFVLTREKLEWYMIPGDLNVRRPRGFISVRSIEGLQFDQTRTFHFPPATFNFCIEIITAEKTLTLSATDRGEWDMWASVLRSVTTESAGGARRISNQGGVQIDSLDCDAIKDLPSRIMAAPASGAGSVVSLLKTARNGEVEPAQAGCRRILELASTTEGREALCMEGAVHSILVAMRGNSEHCSVAEWGCAALAHLASGDDSKVTQRRIHIAESAASAIIAVMRVHSRHARVQAQGCAVLDRLCKAKQNHQTLLRLGSVSCIVFARTVLRQAIASGATQRNENAQGRAERALRELRFSARVHHCPIMQKLEIQYQSGDAGYTGLREESAKSFRLKREAFETAVRSLHRKDAPPMVMQIRRSKGVEMSVSLLCAMGAEEMIGPPVIYFLGEDGVDDGGLSRSWFNLMSLESAKPERGLFHLSSDTYTYQIKKKRHLRTRDIRHFEFLGKLVGKALFDGYNIPIHFTQVFYKHMLGQTVTFEDMATVDNQMYESLKWILDNDIEAAGLELFFSIDEQDEDMGPEEEPEDIVHDGNNMSINPPNPPEESRDPLDGLASPGRDSHPSEPIHEGNGVGEAAAVGSNYEALTPSGGADGPSGESAEPSVPVDSTLYERKPWITIRALTGPAVGKIDLRTARYPVLIGRQQDASKRPLTVELGPQDLTVSREHVAITYNLKKQAVELAVLSSNGAQINGKSQLSTHPPSILPPATTLKIGSHTLSIALMETQEHEVVGTKKGNVWTQSLVPGGCDIPVTNANKESYVRLYVERKLHSGVQTQMNAFLKGLHTLIPQDLISMFDAQELELLLCGLPNLSVDDWRANTQYKNGYTENHPTIKLFWVVLESWAQEERARLLQFVTGTCMVPPEGFKGLFGSNGLRKFQIQLIHDTRRLPQASTCFNELWLPTYETRELLEEKLRLAVYDTGDVFALR